MNETLRLERFDEESISLHRLYSPRLLKKGVSVCSGYRGLTNHYDSPDRSTVVAKRVQYLRQKGLVRQVENGTHIASTSLGSRQGLPPWGKQPQGLCVLIRMDTPLFRSHASSSSSLVISPLLFTHSLTHGGCLVTQAIVVTRTARTQNVVRATGRPPRDGRHAKGGPIGDGGMRQDDRRGRTALQRLF
jgi:hypothetical protein